MCLAGTTETVRARAEEGTAHRISRRSFLTGMGVGGAAMAARLPAVAWGSQGGASRVRDLTHVFRDGFPVYTGNAPSRRTLVTIPENGFYQQEWTFAEHSGTHMDAPGHFALGGRLSSEIDPRELVAIPAVVVDISARVAEDPDSVVRRRDLLVFEQRYGPIPPRAIVCMYSGWEARVDDPDAYRNLGEDGLFHFPGFGIGAVEWLLENRDITGIGVDTLSLDNGPSQTFDVHHTLLGADRYGLENLRNLSRIPPRGARLFVGLIPWEEGSGGPCRVIARW